MTTSGFDENIMKRFIDKWLGSSAHERANKDLFFIDMCEALGVDRPGPKDRSPDYCFEKDVAIDTPDGRASTGAIDFYRRDSFVCEAKQGSESGDATIGTARRGTATWDKAMRGAFGQALRYANYLPVGKPPFLITCDIGNVFEIWTGFGGQYGGYGARRTIEFSQLADPAVCEYFVKIFNDPLDLDPARHAQRVTREVAAKLADLARALEADKHDPELVARFLMRAIFTMFCEDVGLLPDKLFTSAIREHWIPNPRLFQAGVEQLWQAMRDGLPFGFIGKLLRFNGGLFNTWQSLPMTEAQLRLLLEAAACDWANVEPAIFGTLVERALDPVERRALGAHFTPREYIERLVRPAVIEPVRAEWEIAQAEARQMIDKGDAEPTDADRKKAAAVIRRFHSSLVHTRVLDPACGSGNFLYVTLDLFKEIEAEVLRELADLGDRQSLMEVEGLSVNPGQFLGIEINPRAREIADLVLWLGYLQWQRRVFGERTPPEPVLREYRNIVCRDAVLDYDDVRPRLGADGKPITTWDQRTYKTNPVTGKEVPDEDVRVPVFDYVNPRMAEWPEADYVVSNPPFIGNWRMRQALGEGYAEAVRKVYPIVPDSCDYVMYWWDKAAELARAGKVRRFGFITTNSLRQTFSRRVLARHMEGDPPLSLTFAIPDHPWVDSAGGAAVRISMTVAEAGELAGRLLTVTKEEETGYIAQNVSFSQKVGVLHTDLTVGADVTQVMALKSNEDLSSRGMALHGAGFIVTPEEAERLGRGKVEGLENYIRPYLNGKDVMHKPRGVLVIDLHGLKIEEVRDRFPAVCQWVYDRVKPERDQNNEAYRRENWWLFGRKNTDLRTALAGLPRYIATVETAKHRVFQFLDASIRPDNMLVNIALDDAWFLGVISSRFHVVWALKAGGRLGVGNDPRYNKTRCFDPFPFPDPPDDLKARIRELGERLDAHRKRVQAEHPDVTLTGMYNALERLREVERAQPGATVPHFTDKERAFHERALIGILKQIHDELDAAVAEAYGWPADLPDDEILARLVALNHERAEEEKRGIVRWLRPEFQNPEGRTAPAQTEMDVDTPEPSGPKPRASSLPLPKDVPEQLKAIRDFLTARPGLWTVDDIAAAFKGARKSAVEKHVRSLEGLGLLVRADDGDAARWGVASR